MSDGLTDYVPDATPSLTPSSQEGGVRGATKATHATEPSTGVRTTRHPLRNLSRPVRQLLMRI